MLRKMCVAGAIAIAAVAALAAQDKPQAMTFFITSVGSSDGGNLGGLEGADAHCAKLAAAAGSTNRTWRAYLSTQGEKAVHAKDRIGSGPWYNAKGQMIAKDVADLHGDSNNLTKDTQLNEQGEIVNGRGDKPNRHDILTGSNLDGTAMADDADATCRNWTSNSEGGARVGHHDRQGGGQNPTSWNSAHTVNGCSQEALRKTGGDGLFYCFAAK
jgi:hypothetical protein